MSEKATVELEFKHLEAIARYYQFPVAVFLLNPQDFPPSKEDTTRLSYLNQRSDLLEKIEELIESARVRQK